MTVAEQLVEAGCHPLDVDARGWTAIMHAVGLARSSPSLASGSTSTALGALRILAADWLEQSGDLFYADPFGLSLFALQSDWSFSDPALTSPPLSKSFDKASLALATSLWFTYSHQQLLELNEFGWARSRHREALFVTHLVGAHRPGVADGADLWVPALCELGLPTLNIIVGYYCPFLPWSKLVPPSKPLPSNRKQRRSDAQLSKKDQHAERQRRAHALTEASAIARNHANVDGKHATGTGSRAISDAALDAVAEHMRARLGRTLQHSLALEAALVTSEIVLRLQNCILSDGSIRIPAPTAPTPTPSATTKQTGAMAQTPVNAASTAGVIDGAPLVRGDAVERAKAAAAAAKSWPAACAGIASLVAQLAPSPPNLSGSGERSELGPEEKRREWRRCRALSDLLTISRIPKGADSAKTLVSCGPSGDVAAYSPSAHPDGLFTDELLAAGILPHLLEQLRSRRTESVTQTHPSASSSASTVVSLDSLRGGSEKGWRWIVDWPRDSMLTEMVWLLTNLAAEANPLPGYMLDAGALGAILPHITRFAAPLAHPDPMERASSVRQLQNAADPLPQSGSSAVDNGRESAVVWVTRLIYALGNLFSEGDGRPRPNFGERGRHPAAALVEPVVQLLTRIVGQFVLHAERLPATTPESRTSSSPTATAPTPQSNPSKQPPKRPLIPLGAAKKRRGHRPAVDSAPKPNSQESSNQGNTESSEELNEGEGFGIAVTELLQTSVWAIANIMRASGRHCLSLSTVGDLSRLWAALIRLPNPSIQGDVAYIVDRSMHLIERRARNRAERDAFYRRFLPSHFCFFPKFVGLLRNAARELRRIDCVRPAATSDLPTAEASDRVVESETDRDRRLAKSLLLRGLSALVSWTSGNDVAAAAVFDVPGVLDWLVSLLPMYSASTHHSRGIGAESWIDAEDGFHPATQSILHIIGNACSGTAQQIRLVLNHRPPPVAPPPPPPPPPNDPPHKDPPNHPPQRNSLRHPSQKNGRDQARNHPPNAQNHPPNARKPIACNHPSAACNHPSSACNRPSTAGVNPTAGGNPSRENVAAMAGNPPRPGSRVVGGNVRCIGSALQRLLRLLMARDRPDVHRVEAAWAIGALLTCGEPSQTAHFATKSRPWEAILSTLRDASAPNDARIRLIITLAEWERRLANDPVKLRSLHTIGVALDLPTIFQRILKETESDASKISVHDAIADRISDVTDWHKQYAAMHDRLHAQAYLDQRARQ